jgi:hypothetical protein
MKKINKKSIIWAFKTLSILAFGILMIPAIASADNLIYSGSTVYPSTQTNNNEWEIIHSINPSSSNRGAGSETVTITGEGFSPTSVAKVNGSNRSTTFIDSSHLLVQLNSSDTYNNNGGFYITVSDGDNSTGSYSNAAFFTVNSNNSTSAYTNNSNTNNNNSSYNSSSNSTSTNNNNTGTNTNNTSSSSTNNSNQTGSTTDNSASDLASNAIFGSNSFLPSGIIQWILFAILILLVIILVRRIFGAREAYEELPMKYE